MTKQDREFAKSRIEYLLKISSFVLDERDKEALEVAVQVLSQEPCTDAVSREAEKMIRKTAVMEVIKAHMDGEDKNTKAVLSDVMYSVNELETLEQQPCDDAIGREAAIKTVHKMRVVCDTEDIDDYYELLVESFKQLPPVIQKPIECEDAISINAVDRFGVLNEIYEWTISGEYEQPRGTDILIKRINNMPSVTQKSGKWIPVSERLPEDTYPVNITWVNHEPESYYATIKDKPFTATGCYCDGKWYWYSVTCQDYLDEYRYCDVDSMDEAIEVIAWMPLPKPYEPQESEE